MLNLHHISDYVTLDYEEQRDERNRRHMYNIPKVILRVKI
jgi:hypothetical protein